MDNIHSKQNTPRAYESRSGSGSRQGQIGATLEDICEQIGADGYAGTMHEAFAKEIALIIFDVMTLPPDCLIKIGRHDRRASGVQQIYGMLTYEHLCRAVQKFSSIGYEIKSPKTYLRTLLYNSVFELESRDINEYNKKPKGGSG